MGDLPQLRLGAPTDRARLVTLTAPRVGVLQAIDRLASRGRSTTPLDVHRFLALATSPQTTAQRCQDLCRAGLLDFTRAGACELDDTFVVAAAGRRALDAWRDGRRSIEVAA